MYGATQPSVVGGESYLQMEVTEQKQSSAWFPNLRREHNDHMTSLVDVVCESNHTSPSTWCDHGVFSIQCPAARLTK
jgi:hypothetical protein